MTSSPVAKSEDCLSAILSPPLGPILGVCECVRECALPQRAAPEAGPHMVGEEIDRLCGLTGPRKPRVFASRRGSAFIDLSWSLCGTGLREQLCIKAVFAVLPGRLQPRGLSRKHSVLPVRLFLASKGLKKPPPVCQWEGDRLLGLSCDINLKYILV